MTKSRSQITTNYKGRIERRLQPKDWPAQDRPMFRARNIQLEMSDRIGAISCGGIGMILQLAAALHIRELIDAKLKLLKIHKPYHESDHVLNIAFNLLAGGSRLDDLELLRNNEHYLNALDAQRIPDPTTSGDFCRRFTVDDVELLLNIFNVIRVRLWKLQGRKFLQEALLDVDGSIVGTLGKCKEGADFSHKGVYGYQVLVVSLANTGEPLYIYVRSGNRPSHEGAEEALRKAIKLCRLAGFREITIRGDTDFGLTRTFDEWTREGVRFVVGCDARQNMIDEAEKLGEGEWKALERRKKRTIKTKPRQRPRNVKEEKVRERGYRNLRLEREEVAEFHYKPGACSRQYRFIVLRKSISVKQGQVLLFPEVRYLIYATNDWIAPAEDVVFDANDRCNQENLIAQLKDARILYAPVGTLVSNWAYMVTASLAWSLKSWVGLTLPEGGRWASRRREERERVIRMEFRTFLNSMMLVPAQILHTGRRLVYRMLSWSPWVNVLFRASDRSIALRC